MASYLTVIETKNLTPEQLDYFVELQNRAEQRYLERMRKERCSICEKENGSANLIGWYGVGPRIVHANCRDLIEPLEHNLIERLKALFQGLSETQFNCAMNQTHDHVIEEIRKVCKLSLEEYISKNGKEALTNLFNSQGIKVAETVAGNYR